MLGLSAVLKFSQDRGKRYKIDKEADSFVDLPVRQLALTSCCLVWRVHVQKRLMGKSVLQPTCAVYNLYIIYIKFAKSVLLISLILMSFLFIF